MAIASLVFGALAGAAVSYGLVPLLSENSCEDSFPSQDFFLAVSVTGIMTALIAVYLGLIVRRLISEHGRRACSRCAETIGLLGLIVGALSVLPAALLLYAAQSFPLCAD